MVERQKLVIIGDAAVQESHKNTCSNKPGAIGLKSKVGSSHEHNKMHPKYATSCSHTNKQMSPHRAGTQTHNRNCFCVMSGNQGNNQYLNGADHNVPLSKGKCFA